MEKRVSGLELYTNEGDRKIAEKYSYHEVVPGWTEDPKAFKHYFQPGTEDWYHARYYGLTDVSMVLIATDSNDHMGFIITSNGRYYIGDLMADEIEEITKPATWPEILAVLGEKGEKGLKTKELKHVELPEEDNLPVVKLSEG
ncbi:hypothetical protein AbraIFM66950_005127 [Aspergillus brasiliensis]|nr:hypothetical protein AbraIFM66950_005127 [Aspergillus brasiliensis]